MPNIPKMSNLKKVKAKGVKYEGTYRGRGHHVGLCFVCDDEAAVTTLFTAISKDKNLAPLLNKSKHYDNLGKKILVSFSYLDLDPQGCEKENEEIMSMLSASVEAIRGWE